MATNKTKKAGIGTLRVPNSTRDTGRLATEAAMKRLKLRPSGQVTGTAKALGKPVKGKRGR